MRFLLRHSPRAGPSFCQAFDVLYSIIDLRKSFYLKNVILVNKSEYIRRGMPNNSQKKSWRPKILKVAKNAELVESFINGENFLKLATFHIAPKNRNFRASLHKHINWILCPNSPFPRWTSRTWWTGSIRVPPFRLTRTHATNPRRRWHPNWKQWWTATSPACCMRTTTTPVSSPACGAIRPIACCSSTRGHWCRTATREATSKQDGWAEKNFLFLRINHFRSKIFH